MSQIVRIRTQKTVMQDKDLLVKAVEDAGFTCEQPRFNLLGFRAKIRLRGRQIGFNHTGTFYEMVSRGEREADKVLKEITQHYITQLTRQKLEAQGFSVASQEKQKDGRIHLVLRRMA
jgi:hypothetical protein